MNKTCGNCAWKSDSLKTRDPDFCYQFGKTVMRDAPGCEEWRGSLRDEPLILPEMSLVENVKAMDVGVDD